jgi:undecaprenyl-diphosphatase
MTYFDAVILGIVEGLTEFLPVSSTGHMILADRLLNLPDTEQLKAFEVIIQSGAMLAVIWHYRVDLKRIFSSLKARDVKGLFVIKSIFIAFLPAMFFGALLAGKIKAYLFGVTPVAWALIVGGILMIVLEKILRGRPESIKFDEVSSKKSLFIGLAQCAALWPGTSRSMATILGGRLVGLSTRSAAEFSFFLAIPTLLAAAGHDMIKLRASIFQTGHDFVLLGIGFVVSFIVALIVIRGFLKFLVSHSMDVFAWYRIAVGIAFLLFFI